MQNITQHASKQTYVYVYICVFINIKESNHIACHMLRISLYSHKRELNEM